MAKAKANSVSCIKVNLYDKVSEKLFFPLFQRGYVWTDKDGLITNFYKDLFDVAEENIGKKHKKSFVLTPIYYYDEKTNMHITDGQQRLITLTVLIRCINEYLDENKISSIKKLDNFNIEYVDSKYRKAWTDFFENKKYKTKGYSNAYDVAKSFIETLANEDVAYIKALTDLIKHNIEVFLIDCCDADTAYEMFVKLNTSNKPMDKKSIIESTLKQYSDSYNVKLALKPDDKMVVDMIESYCMLLTDYCDSGKANNFALMSFLDNHVVKNEEKFQDFADYVRMVSVYKDDTFFKVLHSSSRGTLVAIFYLMVLSGVDFKSDKGKDYVDYVFEPLLALNLIWKAKGVLGTKINTLFNEIKQDVKREVKPKIIFNRICKYVESNPKECTISKNDFVEALSNSKAFKPDVIKSTLVYDYMRTNKIAYIDFTKVQLEHIYPENPDGEWITKGGYPANEEKQTLLCNRPGNYMLLPSALNQKVSNKFITRKKFEYDDKINENKILMSSNLNVVNFDEFLNGKTVENYMKDRESNFTEAIMAYNGASIMFVD